MITISTYIHFTKEQRERARRTDLANFLISQGEQVKRSGSEYEWLDGSQWRDINLDKRTISVHQKLITKGKVHIEQGAKTISGVRTVTDVPKILIDFLKKQPEHKLDDFVVTSAKGTLMSDTAWRRLWNSYMADLNIKYGDFLEYERQPKSK